MIIIQIDNTKTLGQNPSKLWAKCCLGQYIFGHFENLGILTFNHGLLIPCDFDSLIRYSNGTAFNLE